MTLPGSPLEPRDYEALGHSWLTREIIDAAQLRRVTSSEGAEIVGRNGGGNYAGLVFVYTWPGEDRPREYRLRRDVPDIEYKAGKPHEKAKYLSPPGRGGMLYWPPDTTPEQLTDITLPIVIVEGEKKTLSLFRLSWHDLETAERPHFLAGGIAGVWNWKGRIGKTDSPNGGRQDIKGPIPDLDRIVWTHRKIYLLFDTNVHEQQSVMVARLEFAKELHGRGAEVYLPEIPPEEGINGIDDFLAKHGPEPALALLKAARLFSPKDKLAAIPMTDYGAEQAFELLHGNDFLYDHTAGQWLSWEYTHWERDDKGAADRAMLQTAKGLLDSAATVEDKDEKAHRFRFAFELQNTRSRSAALKSATTNPRFARVTTDFDTNPDLLGVINGVVDLRSGRLLPPDRTHMITRCCPAAYDPHARSERWERFLSEVFEPHPELVAFLQRAAGYSATGHTTEQGLFLLHGAMGANGKTTLTRAIQRALGPHAATAEFSTFAADRDNGRGPRDDIADLHGARMVLAQEARLAPGSPKA